MKIIEKQSFDEERALYGSEDVIVRNCRFDGPADGESALKECSNIEAETVSLTSAIHSGMTIFFLYAILKPPSCAAPLSGIQTI